MDNSKGKVGRSANVFFMSLGFIPSAKAGKTAAAAIQRVNIPVLRNLLKRFTPLSSQKAKFLKNFTKKDFLSFSLIVETVYHKNIKADVTVILRKPYISAFVYLFFGYSLPYRLLLFYADFNEVFLSSFYYDSVA